MKIAITIKPHPTYPATHSVVCVERAGRIYACSWAGTPTEVEARDAWKNDRKAFRPYNSSVGSYV